MKLPFPSAVAEAKVLLPWPGDGWHQLLYPSDAWIPQTCPLKSDTAITLPDIPVGAGRTATSPTANVTRCVST